MENIIISVAGKTGVGKSTVILLLKEFLRENGFDVRFDGAPDFISEEHFDNYFVGRARDVIESLNNKSTITIKELNSNVEFFMQHLSNNQQGVDREIGEAVDEHLFDWL